ncbi:MAG: sodium transporter [Proteobacteria bacterium]|nr:sodium transporter [Pseudomonadota bacterium]
METEPVSAAAPRRPAPTQYGTFAGVFTPTVLTILGVIMYLRLPWVVGNAGLLGGLLIMALALGITAATGLSLSSIATNTRLGAGGPYAIITKSLGIEIGGSVGVPLYLSQALAVAMYVFGFREGWLSIFPTHPALLVDLATFGVVFAIAYLSAGLAFKVQYVVMVVIVVSLVAVFGNLEVWRSSLAPTWWGSFRGSPEKGFSGTSFWVVFSVFFPAATGIMAGANMSGELKNPRRSIPLGTLTAISVSALVYVVLAVWASRAGTPAELTANYTFMVDRSLYRPAVLAGLLGATFSSALSSLVGAPRILLALARDGLIPGGGGLARVTAKGEPRRAMLLSGGIVLAALLLRDLNVIAPLISMFFLIAYAVINVVMLVESSLGLVSFRPTLRLPVWVPLLGTLGCLFAMFIVNPSFSLIAWGMVGALYFWIMQRRIPGSREDVRSGIFVAFAEWAASKCTELGIETARAWKPGFLVPVVDGAEVRGEFSLVVHMTKPAGSAKLLGIADLTTLADLTPRVEGLGRALRQRGVFSTWSVIDSTDYVTGIITGLQALKSAFFRPNVLLLNLPEEAERRTQSERVVREAKRLKVGVALLGMHPRAGLGRETVVNVWLRAPDAGDTIEAALAKGNMHLGILLAYRLARAWRAELNLISVVAAEGDRVRVEAYVEELRDVCRIPAAARTLVFLGTLEEGLARAPQSDMDVFGMPHDLDLAFAARMVAATRSSCLFTIDSGRESALA